MTYYIAVIHKDPDSGYGVAFMDVPGVTAVADTLDDALREAGVALGFAFEDWNGDLPIARTLDQLRQDKNFRDWSVDAVVAAIAPLRGMDEAA